MTLEREDLLVGSCIPELCRSVLAAGQNALAIGRETRRRDAGRVPGERAQWLTANAPNAGGVIFTAGHDTGAVGIEHRANDRCFMSIEHGDLCAISLPHSSDPIIRRREDVTAIVRERRR